MAGQIYNHDFYWLSMQDKAAENVDVSILGDISKGGDKLFSNFGNTAKDGFNAFHEQFEKRALGHFGSGWVWWVYDSTNGKTDIVDGHDAHCPTRDNLIPLLNIDIWEHAYYLDYKNDRNTYIKSFWKYINWKTVSERLNNAINSSKL